MICAHKSIEITCRDCKKNVGHIWLGRILRNLPKVYENYKVVNGQTGKPGSYIQTSKDSESRRVRSTKSTEAIRSECGSSNNDVKNIADMNLREISHIIRQMHCPECLVQTVSTYLTTTRYNEVWQCMKCLGVFSYPKSKKER